MHHMCTSCSSVRAQPFLHVTAETFQNTTILCCKLQSFQGLWSCLHTATLMCFWYWNGVVSHGVQQWNDEDLVVKTTYHCSVLLHEYSVDQVLKYLHYIMSLYDVMLTHGGPRVSVADMHFESYFYHTLVPFSERSGSKLNLELTWPNHFRNVHTHQINFICAHWTCDGTNCYTNFEDHSDFTHCHPWSTPL